jgi:hypothetical protein
MYLRQIGIYHTGICSLHNRLISCIHLSTGTEPLFDESHPIVVPTIS